MWLGHFAVQQKLKEHCKSTVFYFFFQLSAYSGLLLLQEEVKTSNRSPYSLAQCGRGMSSFLTRNESNKKIFFKSMYTGTCRVQTQTVQGQPYYFCMAGSYNRGRLT